MSRAHPKNHPASIRQKLLNISREQNLPFTEVLQYFVMERFLYRMAISEHADKFILKGALLLRAWGLADYRPTMDIDILGMSNNSPEMLLNQIKKICSTEIDDDGLLFLTDEIKIEQINEGADYIGNRVSFFCMLASAKIKMQIDIACGDSVFPPPEKLIIPDILDFPPAKLACYRPETAIAEKFEAMVKFGEANSRIKDFFDIMILSKSMDINKHKLAETIQKTFHKRNTPIPKIFMAYSENFIKTRQIAWISFLKKKHIENAPQNFSEVLNQIRIFLNQPLQILAKTKKS